MMAVRRRMIFAVVVDNTPPKVEIVHPKTGDRYVMEDDEMVSITVDAEDAWEMDRVEFYLDSTKIGESTVAPYSLRWTITMSDVMPALGPKITEMRPITNPDGTIGVQEVVVRETKIEEYKKLDGSKGQRTIWLTESGRGAIIDSGVVTETHTIKVKAFDRAGNEVESKPVTIWVGHKPKQPKPTSWLEPLAMDDRRRTTDDGAQVAPPPTERRPLVALLRPSEGRIRAASG